MSIESKKPSALKPRTVRLPSLDVEAITRSTYERIAESYCRDTPSPDVRDAIISSARRFESLLRPKSKVLILGGGDGRDAEVFIALGHRTVTMDYSAAMTKLARRRVPTAECVLADFRSLPFSESTFDGVWASACLYHVRKSSLSGIIKSILNLLRPGGSFYLNLRRGAHEKLDPHPRSYPIGGLRFYAFYTESEALTLLSDFDILELRMVDPVLGEDYLQLWTRKPGRA
jgi:SAM-dependent methyltransferase